MMRKSWFLRISLLYVTALLLTAATAAHFSLMPAKLSASRSGAAAPTAPATPQPAVDAAATAERGPLTRGPAVRTVAEDPNAPRIYTVESFYMTLKVEPSTGKWEIQEKLSNSRGGEVWTSGEKALAK